MNANSSTKSASQVLNYLKLSANLCLVGIVLTLTFGKDVAGQDRTFTGGGDGTSWSDSNNWLDNNIPNSFAENALIGNGGGWDVTVDGWYSVNDLSLSFSGVTIADSQRLTIAGNIIIDPFGGLLIDHDTGAGGDTALVIAGTTVFGGGELVLRETGAGPGSALITSNAMSGGTFINDNGLIFGTGVIGPTASTSISIVNQGEFGLILAGGDVPGRNLLINTAAGNTFVNQAEAGAAGGGILALSGQFAAGDVDNTNGILFAYGTGSEVQLVHGIRINGGQLETGFGGDGGFVVPTGHTATLTNVTLSGEMQVESGSSLSLSNLFVNNGGDLVLSAGSGDSILQIVDNTILSGWGTIRLESTGAGSAFISSNTLGTSRLLDNHDNTIEGYGVIGRTNTTNVSVINNLSGNIVANVDGETMLINTSGGNTFLNKGWVRAEDGGRVVLSGAFGAGAYSNLGYFEAGDNSEIIFDSNASVTNISGGVLQSGNWSVYESGNGAAIRFKNDATDLIHTIGSNAYVYLEGYGSELTMRSSNVSIEDTLTNVQGFLQIAERDVILSSLTNSGKIYVDGGGLIVQGNFHQTGGEMLLGDYGRLELLGSSSLITGGVFGGNGVVMGDLVLGNGGTLNPGFDAPFDFTSILFDDNLTWNGGGSIELGIGDIAGSSINILGDFLKGVEGSYAFTFFDRGWQVGESYSLITFQETTLTTFSASDFSFTNTGGFNGYFSFNSPTLRFTITAIPEPSSLVLLLATTAALLGTRRRTNHLQTV